MKTLRQIREEAEELLENPVARKVKDSDKAPTLNKLPLILIFRRRSYRYYPDKQIVGLYYNNLTDKYLSVPMGPTPNLNMSEEAEQLEEMPAVVGAVARGAMSMGGKALGWAGKKLIGAAGAVGSAIGSGTGGNQQPQQSTIKYGGVGAKKYQSKSSLDRQAKSANATKNTKLDQVALQPIKENRIKVLRDMLKENKNTVEFTFEDISLPVSKTVSKKILEVYDGLSRNNKKQLEKMLNEDINTYKRLLKFVITK